MSDASDIELLTRWREGHADAGQELARRYFPILRAYFISKAPLDYEELVANTMLRLVDKRDRFQAMSSFRVFVFGMARMILLEHFRAQRRDERFDPMESSAAELEGGRMSSMLARREEHRVLLESLRLLELRDQELLEHYYWQQLSAREIAEISGRPEGTIRTRIRAALERLARRYAEVAAQAHEREYTPRQLEEWLEDVRGSLDEVTTQPR